MKTLKEIAGIVSLGGNFAPKLHKQLKAHYNNYTSEQRQNGIRAYTGGSGSSHFINDYHWRRHKGEPIQPHAKIDFHTKYLDSAIDVHRTPEELTVHSGIKYDPREKMNKEKIVHHPAYLSTSLNKEHATQFAGGKIENNRNENNSHYNVLSIKVPKGHPGAYVGHIQDYASEREFILPRGTNLRHIKTETEKHFLTAPQKNQVKYQNIIHTHHMEIV